MIKQLLFLVLFMFHGAVYAQVEYGHKNYTEYQPGSLNVILASPHGGYEVPGDIPDRVNGCWNQTTQVCLWRHNCTDQNATLSALMCSSWIGIDDFTQNLTRLIADELEKKTGKRPYVIINRLHRSKLDANRDVEQAAQGIYDAIQAWNDFSGFILEAKNEIEMKMGRGIFFDIHGQSHPQMWLELGYVISPEELDGGGKLNPETSSIRHLASQVTADSFDQIVRGSFSFGGLMQRKGYKSVPSPANRGPEGNAYFWGGSVEYNTKTYGSKDDGTVDGIQIESPRYVRNGDSVTTKYVDDLTQTIVEFLDRYYPDKSISGGSTIGSGYILFILLLQYYIFTVSMN